MFIFQVFFLYGTCVVRFVNHHRRDIIKVEDKSAKADFYKFVDLANKVQDTEAKGLQLALKQRVEAHLARIRYEFFFPLFVYD